jgi:hypothetical protein
MIITLLLWIYISFVTYTNGLMLKSLIDTSFSLDPKNNSLSMVEVAWLGMAWLTCLCGYAYLFSSISLGIHLIALLLPLMVLYIRKPVTLTSSYQTDFFDILYNKWLLGIIFLTICVILTRSTLDPRIKDTGGYHAQMIRWIEEYPIVRGLANLNYRLGFNNTWFLNNALFSFSWISKVISFHALNSWAMLSLGVQALLVKKHPIRYYYVGAFLLFLNHFHWQLSSPTPDLPAHLLVVLSFGIWLRLSSQTKFSISHLAVIVLSISAFTIKTSTAPILLLVIVLGVQLIYQKQWKILSKAIFLGILMITYWLISNVILTGYLLYPVANPIIDIFNFDWEVPKNIIEEGINNLTENTRPIQAKQMRFPFWLPYWLPFTDWVERFIYLSILIGSVFWVKSLIRWKTLTNDEKHIAFTMGIVWIGIVFWLSIAPMLRFGIGFVSVAFLLSIFAQKELSIFFEKTIDTYRNTVPFIFHIYLIALLYASVKRQTPTLLLPRPYPTAETSTYTNKGMKIYVAANDTITYRGIKGYWGDCYHHTLPCTPYQTDAFEPRGTEMRTGYKPKKR